jgi:hypothetical protein
MDNFIKETVRNKKLTYEQLKLFCHHEQEKKAQNNWKITRAFYFPPLKYLERNAVKF